MQFNRVVQNFSWILLSLGSFIISALLAKDIFISNSKQNYSKTSQKQQQQLKHQEISTTRMLFDKYHQEVLHSLIDQQFISNRQNADTLIVLTLCNQLYITLITLKYLKTSLPIADLIIMDDHSIDGSADYLRRRGYFVLSSNHPQGLTQMWNNAFYLAIQLNYKYVIFSNNDVIVPSGAINQLRMDLLNNSLVVPLTSAVGSGHNPAQSITVAYNLTSDLEFYISHPHHTQVIQDALIRFGSQGILPCCKPSKYKDTFRFNGFFFGVNLKLIAPAAYQYPNLLFNNSTQIVGQEDSLTSQMIKVGLQPMISLTTFVYHFKSATVGIARKTTGLLKNQTTGIDIRESLLHYHPELSSDKNFKQGYQYLDKLDNFVHPVEYYPSLKTIQFVNRGKNGETIQQCDFLTQTSSSSSSSSSSSNIPLDSKKLSGEFQYYCNKGVVIAFATSDPVKNPSSGDVFTAYELGNSLLKLYSDVISEVRFLRKSKNWYNFNNLVGVDILVSMLDDFDISRVLQLSPSFHNSSRGKYHADISPKLITVAWIRNWFQRWITRPYIGNYDIIMVSSQIAKNFYQEYDKRHMFNVKCFQGCPKPLFFVNKTERYNLTNQREKDFDPQHNFSQDFISSILSYFKSLSHFVPNKQGSSSSDLSRYSQVSKDGISINSIAILENFGIKHLSFQSRSNIPIGLLRLATNSERFTKDGRINRNLTYDYGFTGSYYNVNRKIMDLNPEDVGKEFQGIIIGSGWDKVNRSNEWKNMILGKSLPYSLMPEVYRSLKIVIDDANHVTEPWGSVNSRVYDSLASETLVLTNGVLGASEICNNLIPGYKTPGELVKQLNYYLTHPKERKQLSRTLHDMIIANHTYNHRAEEFVENLSLMSLPHNKIIDTRESTMNCTGNVTRNSHITKTNVKSSQVAKLRNSTMFSTLSKMNITSIEKSYVCIGVRAYSSQGKWIEVLLRGLLTQHSQSPLHNYIPIRIFIIDTEYSSSEFQSQMKLLITQFNTEYSSKYSRVYFVIDKLTPPRSRGKNQFFGYDSTDFLLSALQNSISEGKLRCDWLMFTNGDNMYNSAWLNSIGPSLISSSPKLNAIAWDFVTHHSRGGDKQQYVRVALKRQYIDLGSIIIRTELYNTLNLRYLPESIFTKDLMARDYLLIERLIEELNPKTIKLLHRCLMFHQ